MSISTINKKPQSILLLMLRVAVGWHLFYEGFTKLISPDWTAAGFLVNSKWIFAGLFRWMAANEGLMQVVDFLNIWGLMLIGLGLFFGLFTRITAITGAGLLLLYYVAYPPFAGMDFGSVKEGMYFIVNKNLIEIFALLLLAIFPSNILFSLDNILFRKKKTEKVQDEETTVSGRREILKNLASLPLFGAIFGASLAEAKRYSTMDITTGASRVLLTKPNINDLNKKIPTGKIGNLTISRVFTGFNTYKGHAHSRDLRYVRELMRQYHTEEKIIQTFRLLEATGINSIMLSNNEYRMLHLYNKEYGGNLQSFGFLFPGKGLVPWVQDDWKTQVDQQINNGAATMFICGANTDVLVKNKKFDIISDIIDYTRSQGYLAGLGAHSITDFIECEKLGIEADYYLKSFHHDNYWSAHPREHRVNFEVDQERHPEHHRFHDNMFCLYPEETVKFVQNIKKPFIAFKIFAGGAIPGEEAFQWAFENGADFISCGMMDFQIIPDINLANDALEKTQNRNRIWYG